jgi:hypothetical protein
VYQQELKTPETLGRKVQEFLQKNHASAQFHLLMPDRDIEPVRSGDPRTSI